MFLSLISLMLVQDTTPMAPIGQRTTSPAQLLGTMDPQDPVAEDEAAAAAAARFPLGSVENPIRVGGPVGEANYLARLRCADGSRPQTGGRTDRGAGGYGSVVASYSVQCPAGATDVAFDMYHEEHRETRAPAGLTIVN